MKIHSKRQRWAFLPDGLGGDPSVPDGSTPAPDCCDVTTIPPDRGSNDEGAHTVYLKDPAPPAFVQSKVASNSGAPTTVTATLDADPTPGNLLIALWTGRSTTVAGLGSIGGFPTGFTPLDAYETAVFSGGASRLSYRFVQGGDGAAWGVDGGTRQRLIIAEFSGPTAFDQQTTEINNSASALMSTGAITIGEAALVIGAFSLPTNGTNLLTPAATWTELDDGDVGSGSFGPLHQLIYKFETGAGTSTPADTTTTSGWGAIGAVFDGIGEAAWNGPAPEAGDGDDSTCITIDGPQVLQRDLGAAYRITSTRLRGSFPVGAKTYTILAGNLPDLSDAVTVATLTFTGTGSAQDIEASWYTEDSYRFFELDGDDETRDICAWELYEPTLATNHQHDASGMTYDNGTSGLSADTVQEAIDELDAAIDALGSVALDDLTDVVITSPASGQRLRYNGSNWVNSSLRWEPHVDYTGSVVLDGAGNPVMVEVS